MTLYLVTRGEIRTTDLVQGSIVNRTRVTQTVLCMAIALPALMLGAVHSQTLGIMLFLSGVLYLLLGRDKPIELDFVGWTFLGLIALTALQLVPLPAQLVRILSPESHEIRQSAVAVAGGDAPAFLPLTVDIPLTLNELAKLFLYLAIYWTIAGISRWQSTRFVLQAIAALGFLCAIIFIGHKITMAHEIYGFYTPVHRMFKGMEISAPLINPNHMAAFLGLCAFISMGLSLSFEERGRRVWFVTFSIFSGAALMVTLSRGGIAAFIAGQLVFGVMLVIRQLNYRKSASKGELRWLVWLPVGLALTLGLGMLAAGDAIIGEYVNGDATKLGIWKEAAPLFRIFPWMGAGRGAFVMVFPMVSQWTTATTFTHAENVIVQIMVDYGVIFGPLVLLAFALAIVKRLQGIPIRPTTIAMVAALISVGVHNLVDFNLEIPGVAVVAMAILAVMTVSNRRVARTKYVWNAPFPAMGQFILAVVSFGLCAALLFSLPEKQLETEMSRTETALTGKDGAYFDTDSFTSVMYRHPASHYLMFLAGVYHYRAADRSPLPFWSRAIELNPHAALPPYYVGRFLLERGFTRQAMLELRLAAERQSVFAEYGAAALVQSIDDMEMLAEWAVTPADKRFLYDALAVEFSKRKQYDAAARFDRLNIALKNPAAGALQREARRLAPTHPEKALALAAQLGRISDSQLEVTLLTAYIHRVAGDVTAAIKVLENAPRKIQNYPAALRQLANLYQQNGRIEDAMQTVNQLYAQSKSVSQRVSTLCFEGDLKERQQRFHSALESYKRALAMAPGDVEVMRRMLTVAKRLKKDSLILDILRRLQTAQPNDPQWTRALNTYREKSLRPIQ